MKTSHTLPTVPNEMIVPDSNLYISEDTLAQWKEDILSCPDLKNIVESIGPIANSDIVTLILGETGTGKECFARFFHAMSKRAHEPFIPVNCNAIPRDLLETEMFGYVKGAFTGAYKERMGFFRLAGNGTILIDEIGDLPFYMQGKILRVIQEREVWPVGSDFPVRINCRVLAATNQDLNKLVGNGAFRKDLFYRINALSVEMPPLRNRKQDLPVIATRIIEKVAAKTCVPHPKLALRAIGYLLTHDWPGNIRELENCISTAVLRSQDGWITPELMRIQETQNRNQPNSLREAVAEFEKSLISAAMKSSRSNRVAAEMLKISLSTLKSKQKKYDVPTPPRSERRLG